MASFIRFQALIYLNEMRLAIVKWGLKKGKKKRDGPNVLLTKEKVLRQSLGMGSLT